VFECFIARNPEMSKTLFPLNNNKYVLPMETHFVFESDATQKNSKSTSGVHSSVTSAGDKQDQEKN